MNKKEFVGNKTSQPESIAASLSRVVDIFLSQFALKSLQNQRRNYEPLDVDDFETVRGNLGSYIRGGLGAHHSFRDAGEEIA